jgi:hypothetical protein
MTLMLGVMRELGADPANGKSACHCDGGQNEVSEANGDM